MATAYAIRAVYEDGWLKPLQPLTLPNHQRVEIIVTLSDEISYHTDPDRVLQLHEQAEAWLADQPPSAVREARRFSPSDKVRLDAEFEELLAEIQEASEHTAEAELTALVDKAVAAVRGARG